MNPQKRLEAILPVASQPSTSTIIHKPSLLLLSSTPYWSFEVMDERTVHTPAFAGTVFVIIQTK
jgi:hypothetical protein